MREIADGNLQIPRGGTVIVEPVGKQRIGDWSKCPVGKGDD